MEKTHRPLSRNPLLSRARAFALLLALGPSPVLAKEGLPGSLHPSFSHDFSQPAQVRTAVPTPEGGLLIVGDFQSVNGEPRPGFARLLADGQLDPDFHPAVHIGEVPGRRFFVLPLANGRTFLTAEGWPQTLDKNPPASHAHAFLQPDGSLAPSPFLESLSPHDLIYPVFTAGDRLFLRITNAEGESRLALVNAVTLRELPFATDAWPAVPFDLIPRESGYWALGGSARNSGPTLFRITASGALDETFLPRELPVRAQHQVPRTDNPLLEIPESLIPIASYYLLPAPGPEFLIACEARSPFIVSYPAPTSQTIAVYTHDQEGKEQSRADFRVGARGPAFVHRAADNSTLVTNVNSTHLIRIDSEGEQSSEFAISLPTSRFHTEPFGTNNPGLLPLPLSPDGKIYGQDTRRYLLDGTLDDTWQVPRLRKPGTVTSLRKGPNDTIYVNGHFDRINDVSVRNLIRLHPDGSLDTTFTVDPGIEDTILHDISAEGFLYVTSGTRSNLLHRLRPDGSLDPSFATDLSGSSFIQEAHLDAHGRVLVVTQFESSFFVSHNLIRLSGEGTVDTDFRHNYVSGDGIPIHGSSVQRPIYPLPDGRYLAAAHLFSAEGAPLGPLPASPTTDLAEGWILLGPRSQFTNFKLPVLHRWHPESGLDQTFRDPFKHPGTLHTPLPIPTRISMTHGLRDGRILTAGSLYTGHSYHFLRLHPNGAPDYAFTPPIPQRIVPHPDGLELLLDRGEFRPATRSERTQNASITSALELENGTILIAGTFTNLGGERRTGLAAICGGIASDFPNWCATTFARTQLLTHASGPDDDPDGDGTTNFYEFAIGTDPLAFDIGASQFHRDLSNKNHWILPRNPDAEVHLQIELSTDLITWQLATAAEVTVTDKPHHYRIMLQAPHSTRFLRARFSMP